MSALTPDSFCYEVWNSARGIGKGAVVARKEWQTYAKDLGGWFMYWGDMIDMRAEHIGGGMYLVKGEKR